MPISCDRNNVLIYLKIYLYQIKIYLQKYLYIFRYLISHQGVAIDMTNLTNYCFHPDNAVTITDRYNII